MEENKNRKNDPKKEPNILPATEVVKNPNPRANENMGDSQKNIHEQQTTGAEITDGEDG